jgi:glycosyltransferase involved in cell wall biosynthesis
MLTGIGVVVIGRNEGQRLQRCLASLAGCAQVVYVDSGSTDGSQALAQPGRRGAGAGHDPALYRRTGT